jgi:hypothetical protein
MRIAHSEKMMRQQRVESLPLAVAFWDAILR